MKELQFLNKYFRKYKAKLFLGILFIVIANIFRVVSPRIIGNAIDLVVENISFYNIFNDLTLQESLFYVFLWSLIFFCGTYLLVSLLSGLFTFFMRQTIIVMSRWIEFDLRNEVYDHYQKLDLAFYKRHHTGDLMSRITEDMNRVRMYLGPAIMYSINLVVLCVLVIITMLAINPRLTAFVLIPLPILSLSIYYVNTLINKGSEEIQRKLSDLTMHAQEMYSGIRVIKSYVQEKHIFNFFDKESEIYKDKSLSLARIEALFFPLMLILIGSSIVLTIYVGGIEVIKGRVSPGNIAEFIIYVMMLTWPVTAIGWVASIIQRAAASQKRINEFLATKPNIANNSKRKGKDELKGAIEFNQVTFKYPDTGIVALDNVSFKIKEGEKWAIIGRTGSGKSTIADLIVRMYDPTDGTIVVDQKDLKSLDINALRTAIGYVPQDVFLFSDSIQNNIAFSVENGSLQKAEMAATNAFVHNEILRLPQQYQTVIGERGVTLSGGQKQRISIARALIKEPKILILDDCLSAVDANTENEILGNLNRILENRTSIIITHRIFALLNFDNIIVLENGRIIEQGTHGNLLAQKGLYFELFEKQQLEEKKIT